MPNSKKQTKAFTLVELLVAILIIAILLAAAIPVIAMARSQAKKTVCSSNLGQLGLAFSKYLNDYERKVFPLVNMELDTNNQWGKMYYFGYEPQIGYSMTQGKRPLYRKYAKLFPYVKRYDSIEICPTFPYASSQYKPKYNTKRITYGINSKLCVNLMNNQIPVVDFDTYVGRAGNVLIFADSAQVNAFQSPASPSNPAIEEWHCIEPGKPFVHFRHNRKANVLFSDGCVLDIKADNRNLARWPEFLVGKFSEEIRF